MNLISSEAYSEPSRASTMKLFCKNSYRLKSSTRKSSIVDEQLGSKYASAVDQKANYLNEVSVSYVTMFHIKDHFVLWKKTTEHQNNGFHTWVIVILVQLRRFYRFLWCFYGFWKKFHSFYPRVHLKIQLNNFFLSLQNDAMFYSIVAFVFIYRPPWGRD